MSFPNSRVHIFKNVSISFHNLSAMIAPPKKMKNASFAFFNNQSTFSFPHLYKKSFFFLICLLKLGNKAQTSAQSKPSSTSSLSLSTYLFIIILYYILFKYT